MPRSDWAGNRTAEAAAAKPETKAEIKSETKAEMTPEKRAANATEVVIEAGAQLFDYEQKYMPGRALKITPARCSQADQEKIINVPTGQAFIIKK